MSKRGDYSGTSSDWALYRRLLGNLSGYWGLFFLSIVGFFLYSMAQVLVADWSQFVIDTLSGEERVDAGIVSRVSVMFTDSSTGDIKESTLYNMIAASVIVLSAFRGFGYFIGNYFMALVSTIVVHRLRLQVFEQILVAPATYYDTSSTGDLLAKVTYHVSQVTGAATDAIKVVVREGFYAVGLLSYLLYKDWRLTLVFLVVLPVIGLIVTWVGRQFRRISRRIQDSVGDVNQVASEVIGGYKEIRVFGGTEYERGRFTQSSERNLKQTLKMAFMSAISSPVIQMVVWTALGVLVWLALNIRTDNTAGEFVAYIGAAGMLAKPIRQLSEVMAVIQKGLAACDDLYSFIDMPGERDDGSHVVDRARGSVEFRQLSFAYSEGQGDVKDVLSDINLTVEPGQTVALVGLSGSGKTTLVGLLPRFYDHTRGEIRLDGVEINDYQLSNLRQQIAFVTQQVTLFNDTIYNNIAYGAQGVSPEQVRRAAEAAHATEFIKALPEGMATIVGEDGVMLSGGQRQRIAIARAILKDAPVLILDEATSALDNKAEFLIQEALNSVMEDRTSLVIAHRLSTIENADVILVMEAGRIVERGSHAELLALQGHYAALHARNFEESDDDSSPEPA